MNHSSKLLRTMLLAAAASSLFGCPCGPATPVVAWHFESDCTNDLCGFNVGAGQATRVSAIAPGEHALELAPGTEIDQSLMQSIPASSFQSLVLSFVARCENNAAISSVVTVNTLRSSDAAFSVPTLTTLRGATTPVGDWQRYDVVLSSPSSTTLAGTINGSILVGIQIQNDNSGRCWVDDISVSRPAFCD